MNSKKNRWNGLRAIVVARQSNDDDGDASTEAQLDHMKLKLSEVSMHFVDQKLLEGVSASAPARISEVVEELFARKLEKNDFDVIAWQIEDRASRGGSEHGMWLQHEAKRRGLKVFFPDDADGNMPAAYRAFKFEAAKDAAIGTGRRAAQGQTWAQKQGYFRTAGNTPIGCDRIYYGPDDKPRYTIRNLPNGLQEQREYGTNRVIGRYGTIGEKSQNRFKKQTNEYSLLCPGDPELQQLALVINYLRFKRGWRGMRIADLLNRNGRRTGRGNEWTQRQVQIVYENPAYTGCTYNNKTYSGRFFRRDRALGFVPLDRDECELVQKKVFTPKLRPTDDWDRIDQPHMYDFLPRDVRDLAIAEHAKLDTLRTDPNRPKKALSAHPASLFFLSGKLEAIQGGTLIGSMSGPHDQKIPYYRHRKGKRRTGTIYNNLIPAKPLHDAILSLLTNVLKDTPDLRNRLRQHVESQRIAAAKVSPDLVQLEEERADLQQQIRTICSTLKGAAREAVANELQRLGGRLNAVTSQIDTVAGSQDADLRPIDEIVEDTIRVIQQQRAALHKMPIEVLRTLVEHLIIKATVDMETKAVELTVALPTWAPTAPRKKLKNGVFTPENEEKPLCPATSTWSPVGSWTQCVFTVVSCQYEWTRGSTTVPPCYRCRRKAA